MPSPVVKSVSHDVAGMIDRLIEREGGYVNHPRDPGGETKYGITKRTYPDLDIRIFPENTPQISMRGISTSDLPSTDCVILELPSGSWIGWFIQDRELFGTYKGNWELQ